MGIVDMLDELNLKPGESITCVICSVRQAVTGTVVGQGGRGCELFADVSRFMDIELLARFWTDIAIRERNEARKTQRYVNSQQGDGQYARTDT